MFVLLKKKTFFCLQTIQLGSAIQINFILENKLVFSKSNTKFYIF